MAFVRLGRQRLQRSALRLAGCCGAICLALLIGCGDKEQLANDDVRPTPYPTPVPPPPGFRMEVVECRQIDGVGWVGIVKDRVTGREFVFMRIDSGSPIGFAPIEK